MQALKMLKNTKREFMTKEEIAEFRKSLEKATEKPFKHFEEAKRKVWQESHNIVLDWELLYPLFQKTEPRECPRFFYFRINFNFILLQILY